MVGRYWGSDVFSRKERHWVPELVLTSIEGKSLLLKFMLLHR